MLASHSLHKFVEHLVSLRLCVQNGFVQNQPNRCDALAVIISNNQGNFDCVYRQMWCFALCALTPLLSFYLLRI
jgi:hypothetical protein